MCLLITVRSLKKAYILIIFKVLNIKFLGSNLYQILYPANKYQMTGILGLCEEYMLALPASIHHLMLAQNCQLNKLLEYCCERLAKNTALSKFKADKYYANLDSNTRSKLLEARLTLFETKWQSMCRCRESSYTLINRGSHSIKDCAGEL